MAFLALMPMSLSISISPFSPRAALTARSCRVSIRLASSSASIPAIVAAPAYSCQLPVDRPTMLANLLASAAAVAASVPRAKAPPPAAPNSRDRRPARAPRRSSPACPCCTMPWSLSRTLPMLPERRCRPVTLEKRPRAWRALLGAIPDSVHSLLDAAERSGDTLHGIDDQVKPALLALGHQSCSMSFCSFLVRSAHQARSRAVIRSSSEGGQWYSQASRVRASSQSAGHSRKKRR